MGWSICSFPGTFTWTSTIFHSLGAMTATAHLWESACSAAHGACRERAISYFIIGVMALSKRYPKRLELTIATCTLGCRAFGPIMTMMAGLICMLPMMPDRTICIAIST